MSRSAPGRRSAGGFASGLVGMLALAVALGVVTAGLAIPFAGLLGFGARDVARTMDKLPADFDTGTLPQRTRIVDANGKTLATLYEQNRVVVPLSEVSREMTQAIVAIEDYRFYQHGALDLKGTLRALVTNQANGGAVQGGSSITQQLVKNTLLIRAGDDVEAQKAATADTYQRKIKELRYAIALENKHSKDWILERYLNSAYFGDGAWGIQAAARHYFNRNARGLTLPQAALLAGLVKNPTGYDPTNSPDRALQRRSVVLNRMAQLGVISQADADTASESPLGLRLTSVDNGCINATAPFFCDYVVNRLLDDPSLGDTVAERSALLMKGGLVVKTTVDLADQRAADTAVRNHVDPTDQAIGALAMVQPGTGDVKALAQSRPMGRDQAAGQTFLNYVVPQQYGDSAGFQPGSTFKPFVLASALDQGIPLSTRITANSPMTFDSADFANCPGEPAFAGTFPIQNSTINGNMDVATGTRESVNTFYIQLEQRTGVCQPFELAKAMGVDLNNPLGDKQGNGAERVPTFTLGVPSASPLEMAEAYATFGARGLHCDNRPITEIDDLKGNVLKTFPSQCTQVMSQAVADSVNQVLRGVIAPGGFAYAQQLDKPAAGKTGTITGQKAVWFLGYTPTMAAAAMIAGANDFGTPITLAGQVVGGGYIGEATGSGYAAPIWGDAMKAIQDTLPYVDFATPGPIPSPVALQPAVPDTTGMSVAQAQEALQEAGFAFAYGGRRGAKAPEGDVAYTYPSAGLKAPAASTVTVYESTGTPRPTDQQAAKTRAKAQRQAAAAEQREAQDTDSSDG